MSNVKQGAKAQETGHKPNAAAELARKTYANGSIFKTIIKITFPVFILMVVNSLYQMIDTIIASQLVDYGYDAFGKVAEGAYKGAITMQYIIPMVMVSMAFTVLINVGYGTSFSQKMGAGDVDGAKRSTSTALWLTFILGMFSLSFTVTAGPAIIRANMPDFLFDENFPLGDNIVDLNPLGNTMYKDAQWTCFIYVFAVTVSGVQGICSRQLRAEGHIKAMSYLPLLSIPFNIGFDFFFMGTLDMEVSGAALATLIAIGITSSTTLIYSYAQLRKGKTLFTLKAFKEGIDGKLAIIMLIIGIVPFAMQMFRLYDSELAIQLITNLVEKIPGDNKFEEAGHWSTFYTAATRPMMLVMMPGVAVLQAGSAFLGYNYGAKNYHRVNKGIIVMIGVMLLYATPSWLLLLIFSRYVLVWFGVGGSYAHVETTMIAIQRIIIGLSLFNILAAAPNAYVISTKRPKTGLMIQVVNLIGIYTAVIFAMYYSFAGTENYMWFYTYNAIFIGASALFAITVLGIVILKDHKRLVASGHVDAHLEQTEQPA